MMKYTQYTLPKSGSDVQIGNRQFWGKNWGLKVVIDNFSVMNL